MTPIQAIKEIDTVIEQIISKTEKDKAEKLKQAYEVCLLYTSDAADE